MSAEPSEEICIEAFGENSFISKFPSDFLRIFGLILFFFGLFYFPFCFIYFCYNKNISEKLQKRSLIVLIFNTFGFFLFMMTSPFRLAVGDFFRCDELILFPTLTATFLLIGTIVRMFKLKHKIDFNKIILKTKLNINLTKNDDILHKISYFETYFSTFLYYFSCFNVPERLEEELVYPFYLTTVNFTRTLYIFSFFITIIPSFTSFGFIFGKGIGCRACLPNIVLAFVVFIPIILYFLLVGSYIFIKIRSFPDYFGIKYEFKVCFLLFIIVHFGIVMPLRFIFPSIERDGIFDLTLFDFAVFVFISFYTTIYQIWNAKAANKKIDEDTTELDKLLLNEEEKNDFALFLTYSLGLENLLYLETMKKWQNLVNEEGKEEVLNETKNICELFIKLKAPYRIYIKKTTRKEILSVVNDDKNVDSIFENATKQVKNMLNIQLEAYKLTKK